MRPFKQNTILPPQSMCRTVTVVNYWGCFKTTKEKTMRKEVKRRKPGSVEITVILKNICCDSIN